MNNNVSDKIRDQDELTMPLNEYMEQINNWKGFDDDEVSLSVQDISRVKQSSSNRSSESLSSGEKEELDAVHYILDGPMGGLSNRCQNLNGAGRNIDIHSGNIDVFAAEGSSQLSMMTGEKIPVESPLPAPGSKPVLTLSHDDDQQSNLLSPTCSNHKNSVSVNTMAENISYASHVSPMPPTPKPQTAGIDDVHDTTTPTYPSHMQTNLTLAALYQSSRRSKASSPVKTTNMVSPRIPLPPPPPLASPSPVSSSYPTNISTTGSSSISNNANTDRPSSLTSSLGNTSTSSMLRESWQTSMSSLMDSSTFNLSFNNSFNVPPPLYNVPNSRNNRMREYRESVVCPPPTPAPMITPGSEGSHATSSRSMMPPPNVERPSLSSIRQKSSFLVDTRGSSSALNRSPVGGMDPGLVDLANTSSTNVFAEQFSRLQVVRSRSKFEEGDKSIINQDEGNREEQHVNGIEAESDSSGSSLVFPPRKKKKRKERSKFHDSQGNKCKSPKYEEEEFQSSSECDVAGEHAKSPVSELLTKRRSNSVEIAEGRFASRYNSHAVQDPETPKSCCTNVSFDIIAHPHSNVSSIKEEDMSDDISSGKDKPGGETREEGEDQNNLSLQESGATYLVSQVPTVPDLEPPINPSDGRQTSKDEEETPSEKHQRIVRRKVQRLLLIRHATRCTFEPPHVALADVSSSTITVPISNPMVPMSCPVSSHCAEGKALCAHIRNCKLENCRYKKCLTSRDVLAHYKSCKDRRCEICGPVRAVHAKSKEQEKEKEKQNLGGILDVGHPKEVQWKREDTSHPRESSGDKPYLCRLSYRRNDFCASSSSIDTIEDEDWLNANLMIDEHYKLKKEGGKENGF